MDEYNEGWQAGRDELYSKLKMLQIVRCSDCAAWVRDVENYGKCRRYGPILLSGETRSMGHWPTTTENDGCCDGIPKEK
jgi:hypothetical protein